MSSLKQYMYIDVLDTYLHIYGSLKNKLARLIIFLLRSCKLYLCNIQAITSASEP